jgi:hypothetical protein
LSGTYILFLVASFEKHNVEILTEHALAPATAFSFPSIDLIVESNKWKYILVGHGMTFFLFLTIKERYRRIRIGLPYDATSLPVL